MTEISPAEQNTMENSSSIYVKLQYMLGDAIGVPPGLVQEWCSLPLSTEEVLVIAAQWGADQELEACCEWIASHFAGVEKILRAARRPKPPSLKEQALKALSEMEDDCLMVTHAATIRNALESIDD